MKLSPGISREFVLTPFEGGMRASGLPILLPAVAGLGMLMMGDLYPWPRRREVSIPAFQALMRPTLAALDDGEPRTTRQVADIVAERLRITLEERSRRVKTGSRVFDLRVAWALTYMVQAGLIRRPKRGVVEITDRGRQVLLDHPESIDNRVLGEFPEFQEFRTRTNKTPNSHSEQKPSSSASSSLVSSFEPDSATSPEETIKAAVDEINAAVATELLTRIREQPPAFFGEVVLELLTAMGYGGAAGSAEQLGRSGDEGLDGVIRQDALGLDRIYVQAKRYAADNGVGRPDIQAFVGALHGAQADRGVFITTSRFSQEAYDYAEKVAARVILIDGVTFADLMVKHGVGVQIDETYILKKIDEDFFEDA